MLTSERDFLRRCIRVTFDASSLFSGGKGIGWHYTVVLPRWKHGSLAIALRPECRWSCVLSALCVSYSIVEGQSEPYRHLNCTFRISPQVTFDSETIRDIAIKSIWSTSRRNTDSCNDDPKNTTIDTGVGPEVKESSSTCNKGRNTWINCRLSQPK